MAEVEFTATGVQIGKRLRALTRAGKVQIANGRLVLLTSRDREIDSAPVQAVQVSAPWYARRGGARARVNGTRYQLNLAATGGSGAGGTAGPDGGRAVSRFLDALRRAREGSAAT